MSKIKFMDSSYCFRSVIVRRAWQNSSFSGVFLLLFLISLFSPESIYGELIKTDCIDESFRLIARQEYKRAEAFLDKKSKEEECGFDAHFGRLLLDQTRMMDYESYNIHGKGYLRDAERFLKRVKKMYNGCSQHDSLKYMFYEGNVLGSIGVVLAKTGHWIKAAGPSIRSVKLLKEVKERDPEIILANYGVGLFKYYMGSSVNWFPSMREKADRGIKMIDTVSEFGIYPFNLAAKQSLAWILIEQDKYSEARSIVNSVLSMLPGNSIFLRIKARIHLWTQEYEQALEYGEKLVRLSLAREPVNWSDLISGLQVQVAALYETGEYEEAEMVINRALAFRIPESYREIEYIIKYTESIKEIREKINGGSN